MSQTASNLPSRFARAQPRIEGAVSEQGVSQGVEAVNFVKLGELGRGSKRRDGSAGRVKLAVADKPSDRLSESQKRFGCATTTARGVGLGGFGVARQGTPSPSSLSGKSGLRASQASAAARSASSHTAITEACRIGRADFV